MASETSFSWQWLYIFLGNKGWNVMEFTFKHFWFGCIKEKLSFRRKKNPRYCHFYLGFFFPQGQHLIHMTSLHWRFANRRMPDQVPNERRWILNYSLSTTETRQEYTMRWRAAASLHSTFASDQYYLHLIFMGMSHIQWTIYTVNITVSKPVLFFSFFWWGGLQPASSIPGYTDSQIRLVLRIVIWASFLQVCVA